MKIFRLSLTSVIIFYSHFVFAAVTEESETFDAASKYQATCFACHGTGQAHAPVVGDIIEWEIRLEKGVETLVNNTINGLNGIMPARGLCTDCSDEELKSIVEYMLSESE